MATTTYWGQQLTDANIKKELIRKIIYHQSDLISVGTKVVDTVNMDALDVKFNYPSDMSGVYPLADDAVADREKVVWSEFTGALRKAQIHYMLLDSAKLRTVAGTQANINVKKSAEALAKLKDNEIMEVLYAGAGATAVTAGAKWNTTTSDAEKDVVSAWTKILDESNVNAIELKKMALIVPTDAVEGLKTLTLINNIQRSVEDYLGTNYGINIFMTRSTKLGASNSTDALLMVMGGMTAQHLVLSPRAAGRAGVPLVESERVMGLGNDYLITQWYKTVVIEDGAGDNTNYRICKIQTVV